MPGQIASSRPLLSLGGVNLNLPNLSIPPRNSEGFFTLWAARANGNTNGHVSFTRAGGSGSAGAYQVTAGKTLRVVSMAYGASASGFEVWQFIYDTAAMDIGGASATTAPVYQFGASARYYHPVLAANTWYSMNYTYEFPATRFPGIQAATSPAVAVVILCHEV